MTCELTELLGEAALSQTDRAYLRFADEFNRRFMDQGVNESRTLDDTLTRAWAVTSVLPRRELTMLSADVLDAHYHPDPTEPPS